MFLSLGGAGRRLGLFRLVGVLALCQLLVDLAMVAAASDEKPSLTPSQLQNLADTAMAKGDHTNAIKYYGQLIKAVPSQLNYFRRASVYLKKKEHSKAVRDLTKAIEQDSKFVKGFVARAKSYTLSGECSEAVEDYQTVLKLKPNNKDALKMLPKARDCAGHVAQASALMDMGQGQQAALFLSEALKIAYHSSSLLLMRAQAHMKHGDFQSVLVDTRQVLKLDKKNLVALLLRGGAYYYMGDHDVAMQHYREGLRSDPEHKQLKAAATTLKSLIKATKSGEDALAGQKFEEAQGYFKQALEVDPGNTANQIHLYMKLCEAYYKGEKFTEGIAACTSAIDLKPEYLDAWMKRGEAKIAAEMFEEAVRDYTKATEIDGSNRAAQEGLNRANLELKKSKRKNYYKILGVPKNANPSQIKKAFRKLALVWHPDKHKGEEAKEEAEKKFRDIGEAYEVLSDEEKKAKYDRGEDIEPNQGGGGPRGHPFQHFQQGGFHFRFN